MKKAFTVLFALTTIKLSAQISITAANMPSIDDTIRYTTAPNGSFDFTQTGANYSWDFSNLGITNQTVQNFQKLANTPYKTLAFTGMPAGAIGVKQADSVGTGQTGIKNIYSFYDKKATGWSAVGTGFTLSALPLPSGSAYTDKDEIYTFPLNYNDQDSTTFYVKTILGNIIVNLGYNVQKGYRVNKVEGWGTITTPYGNNISCLKVKSRVVEMDSLNISAAAINIGFPNNRVEYKWLSTSEKIPVLEVVGTEVAGVFTPTTIRYRDHYRVAPPSILGPKVRFSVDRTKGVKSLDTFTLVNSSMPPFGNSYTWTITPAAGVRYVKSTSATSANPSLVFDNTGLYTVKLSASNFSGTDDSTATDMITIISGTSGIGKLMLNENGLLYPNPVTASFQLKDRSFENKICMIFDATGKLLLEQCIAVDLRIDCSILPNGVYSMVVRGDGILFTEQFIKE